MTSENKQTPAAPDAKAPKGQRATPNSEMQADDAGTPQSGQANPNVRGTAAEAAMKQQSKTGHESGSGGR
jgi:hypothetical protein